MAKKTTEQSLDDLFDAFTAHLKQKLEDNAATAADLAVIHKFLKDNGVDYIAERRGKDNSGEEQQRLAELLPFKADEAAAA